MSSELGSEDRDKAGRPRAGIFRATGWDYGTPSEDQMVGKAKYVAALLREGERVVLHCGAGIGRTGMVATAVLMALGLPLDAAEARIREAGSKAETNEQKKLLHDVSRALR